MTPRELLAMTRQAGIVLEVRGDRLHVEAPAGIVTAGLLDQLTWLKPALLTLLAPPRAFVPLRRGPTLPAEAIELAIDLERRAVRLSLDASHQFQIEPMSALTDVDWISIARWRLHLGAIVAYDVEMQEDTVSSGQTDAPPHAKCLFHGSSPSSEPSHYRTLIPASRPAPSLKFCRAVRA